MKKIDLIKIKNVVMYVEDCLQKMIKKVRDHCHFTGKYRGAAHSKCNMNYKITKNIPIISHKLSSYDCHLIIKEIAKEFDGELEYLGENTENIFVFFSKN